MSDIFPIVPAQGRWMLIVAGVVAVLLAVVVGLLIASARGSRSSSFEVSAEGLRLRGDVWGRLIPASALRGADARVVNLTEATELRPSLRVGGTAVPGYQSGWYRLKNGEKALLYVTNKERAVYVPTTKGYSLLLSPQDPERFVSRVKAIASGP